MVDKKSMEDDKVLELCNVCFYQLSSDFTFDKTQIVPASLKR